MKGFIFHFEGGEVKLRRRPPRGFTRAPPFIRLCIRMSAAQGNPAPLTGDPSILEFLGKLVAAPEMELEWIDLLSQLEFVGCRKIVKSVAFEAVSLEILRHVSEEASHAFLLKSVVEEGGLRDRSWREGRFAEAGWRYFQGLDQRISALPGSEGLRYPGVSWAI